VPFTRSLFFFFLSLQGDPFAIRVLTPTLYLIPAVGLPPFFFFFFLFLAEAGASPTSDFFSTKGHRPAAVHHLFSPSPLFPFVNKARRNQPPPSFFLLWRTRRRPDSPFFSFDNERRTRFFFFRGNGSGRRLLFLSLLSSCGCGGARFAFSFGSSPAHGRPFFPETR